MNNIHKVIFNKNTQQFVVVSELAKLAGKVKAISVVSVSNVPFLQNFSKKQPLVISHQSDLKLGQFSRVSSPLIDLVQTVEQATNNHNANDRVQAAQALGAAAKAYTTAANLANGGALIRAETGTGYSHSRDKQQTTNRESVGNQLNAQHINITSRSGDINATHTAFTSKDEQGNRLKDSSVTFDSARDINFSAGQSEYQLQGRQQSSGFEAGTGVAVGAQTGWYFYAQAGFSNGKQDERHLTHHNSQIDSETVNIKSQGDATLKGATARGNRINADIQGKLTIESLQDEHRSNSSSAGFGGRVQAAIGTAWGASGYGNLASGNANAKQVAEQSGFFAEDGGYNVSANEVSLIGGAIASSNPANSTLITNNITFSDIQNQSSSQAFTGGISGGANLNGIAGTQAQTDEQAQYQAEIAKLTGTPQSNAINTGVPMFDQSRDNSTTKATLTEGTIILHKDTNPTQTTAKELGINTELAQANRQVEQPKDINQTLREQQILSQAAGNVSEAVMTYAENQKIALQQAEQNAREAAEKAAKSGDTTTTLAKLQEAERLKTEAERWESGGDNKRKATAVATALSLAVAGKPTEAIATGAASPYINETIKQITENTDSKALEALNVPLHILWGAVEAELAGSSAKAGAVAAGVGEIGVRVLAETVYGKKPSELNEEEKQNLLTTSKALAGIAVAGTNGGNGAETLANASVGMTVAENAVENNLFNQIKDAQTQGVDLGLWAKGQAEGEEARRKAEEELKIDLGNAAPVVYQAASGAYFLVKKTGEIVYVTRQFVVDNALLVVGLGAVGSATKVAQTAIKYPKATETAIVGTASTIYDIYNGNYDFSTDEGVKQAYESVLANYALAGIGAGKSVSQQLSINTGVNLLTSYNDPKLSEQEANTKMIATTSSSAASIVLNELLKGKLRTPAVQGISTLSGKYIETKINETEEKKK